MVAQFRQIGVPDVRTTNAEVRQLLRRAQQRTEALLNRPELPRLPTLLNAISVLRQTLLSAYSTLPLQRLNQMITHLDHLYEDVDRGVYFGVQPNAAETVQALRHFYSDLTGLLVHLTEPMRRPRRDPETDVVLKKFLERAAARGWKVPEQQNCVPTQQDDFVQSVNYLRKISIAPQQLLPPEDDFGVTTGSIVLMTEQPIPESTLKTWANQRDVYIVFGHYVVLPNVKLLGIAPKLAVTGQNGTAAVNIGRFISISELLHETTEPAELIRYPRRVQHHYYCPLIGVAGTDRRFFRTWDLLIQQEQQHGTKDRNHQ